MASKGNGGTNEGRIMSADNISRVFGKVKMFGELVHNHEDEEAEELYYSLPDQDKALFSEIAKAILLFTGGHVAAVRNPQSFEEDKAKKLFDGFTSGQNLPQTYFEVEAIDPNWVPSLKDYSNANGILYILMNSVVSSDKMIFRGLKELPANIFLDLTKPGSVYDIGSIVSTTTSKHIASSFAKKPYSLVYWIKNDKAKGIDVSRSSMFVHEKETIISGKIRIDNITWGTYRGLNSWDMLVKEVTEIENANGKGGIGTVKVEATLL